MGGRVNKEIIARVKAIIKRAKIEVAKQEVVASNQLIFDDLIIDLEAKELIINAKQIILTKTEFELLTFLAKNPDKLLSREDIIDVVWRETPFITERTVDVHITRLRKKMGEFGAMIVNRSGYGYKFVNYEL